MARRTEKSIHNNRHKHESNKTSKTKGAVFGRFGGGNNRGRKCFFSCGEFGHRAVQCPRVQAPAASSVGSVQEGRGGVAGGSSAPARVYVVTRRRAQASADVVTGKEPVIGRCRNRKFGILQSNQR